MSTVPSNPTLIDALDTYYSFIYAQYQLLNSSRQLCGIVNAQDWPQAELVDGGLYLLYLSSAPVPEMSTKTQTYFEHFVQWAWTLIGDDLQSDQVGLNRGDRYRTSLAIEEELRQVHFPGFCAKQFSQVDAASGTVAFTQYAPIEMIHWSAPKLGVRMANAQSGLLYGTAPVEVYGFSTVNPLLNA